MLDFLYDVYCYIPILMTEMRQWFGSLFSLSSDPQK